MNQDKKLANYIYRQLQSGVDPSEITQQLKGAGWNDTLINSAFAEVRQHIKPSYQQNTHPDEVINKSANIIKQDYNNNSENQHESQPQGQLLATGQKRGKFKTSWLLLKQTVNVFKNNKQLVRYPLASFIANLILSIIAVVVFIFAKDLLFQEANSTYMGESASLTGLGYIYVFMYYVLTSTVVYIFSAALTGNVLDIFKGQSKSYKAYMQLAFSKIKVIFLFAVITTTVGFILRALEQRFRFIGFIVSRFIGLIWALANLFTIPVIVETDKNAPAAIKESSQLFIARWGENIIARVGFGAVTFLIYLGLFMVMFVLMVFVIALFGAFGVLLSMLIFVLAIITFALVENTLSTILNTAIYFYTKYNQVPAAFDRDLLNASMVPKSPKKGFLSRS